MGHTGGRGPDVVPRIEFLYALDCPSHDEALARLREVLTEQGCTAEVVLELVLSRERATARRFLGSPTIRINGVDIEPGSEAGSDYSLSCRAYTKADGRISPLPPRELIRAALARAESTVTDNARREQRHGGGMPAFTLGSLMPDFVLDEPATGGQIASKDFPPHTPVVVAFTSNHCPHALAWEERLLQIGRDYRDRASMVMISSNDPEQIDVCTPEAIAARARERAYPMPYLFDADQSVALAYDAERTPDVFVFDGERRLIYHGTVDDNEEEPDMVKSSHVRDALAATLAGKEVPIAETPLQGCGIKWTTASVGSIRYAGKLMAKGTWTDEQLASILGYRDLAHFTDRFKEVTGESTEQFRAALA